ncbi:hypothetical protein N9B94_01530 [Verrucomicrobia bacterium]|nr:hypothetical protein [Verrucomicrobiota bacterium]
MMKSWILTALLAVFFSGAAVAQDTKNDAPKIGGTIVIHSDRFEIDLNIGKAVYTGNVIIEDKPEMEMKCDLLTLDFDKETQELLKITASGKVRIFIAHEKGSGIASGGLAVFDVVTDRVELSQDASMETTIGKMWGDLIYFERSNYKLRARGNTRMEIDPEALKKAQEEKMK